MTDLIERSADPVSAEPASQSAPTEAGRPAILPGHPDRWTLAAFSGGAGLIHVVMAPSHLGASALEGWGFLVSGWIQLLTAIALVARPTRRLLMGTIVVNVALVGIWAVSRTAGLPFGAHADHPESVSVVDGAAVAFEVLLVGLALLALLRPAALSLKPGLFATGVPLAVFALATAVIASPEARDHSAHSHGTHAAHGDMAAAAGHDHGTGAAADDKGLSLLENGHQHGGGEVALDSATQAALTAQLVPTSELVRKYPTVAAAEAAGYTRAGPFSPGLGTHYSPPQYNLNRDGVVDPEDIDDPMLIFNGRQPDSPLAGFMYMIYSADEPEGFVGSNDHWHYHTNVCIVSKPDGTIDTPFGADLEGVTDAMCEAKGGRLLDITSYMVHLWTVPGWESSRGVFSEINPKLTCPDGTYYQIEIAEIGDKDTVCR